MNIRSHSKPIALVVFAAALLQSVVCRAADSDSRNKDLFSVRKALYEVQAGETLEDIARRFLGSEEFVQELMKYNRINDASEVREGFILVLPGADRVEAAEKFKSADEALSVARSAMAETYAPEAFQRAAETIAQGRENLSDGNYDKAAALGELGRARAQQAKKLADERAIVQQAGTFTAVSGQVDVSLDNERTWRPASVGDEFPVKAVIRTAAGARAELTLGDGSEIQVQESSKFVISKFRFDRRNEQRESEMQVYVGNILGKVAPRKTKDSTFRVHSRSTVLAIRGTDLRVGTDLAQTTRVAVLDGDIVVTARKREMPVPGNFGTWIDPGEAPRKPIVLLPPPQPIEPGVEFLETPKQVIDFQWQHVDAGIVGKVTRMIGGLAPASASYHLEIATDEKFNYVVQDHRTAKNYLASDVLAPGDYFWRITTVDRNGLEGPPTELRRMRVIRDLFMELKPDVAPVVRGDAWIIGPKNVINVVGIRPQSSIVSLIYRLGDGDFQRTDGRIFLHTDGDHLLQVRAIGADGHLGEFVERRVIVDTRGPQIISSVSPVTSDPEMGEVVFVSFDTTDDSGVRSVQYRINDGEYQTYSGRLKVSVTNNYVGIRVQAVDIFGKPFLDKYFKPARDIKVECNAVDMVGNRSYETLTLTY